MPEAPTQICLYKQQSNAEAARALYRLCSLQAKLSYVLEARLSQAAHDCKLVYASAAVDDTKGHCHGGHKRTKHRLQLAHAKVLKKEQQECVSACRTTAMMKTQRVCPPCDVLAGCLSK